MASYRIEWKGSAERDLRRISRPRIPEIVRNIEALAQDPFPRRAIKLSEAEDLYRLRIGVYRVVYGVDREFEAIVIYYIRHRREAYRRL